MRAFVTFSSDAWNNERSHYENFIRIIEDLKVDISYNEVYPNVKTA